MTSKISIPDDEIMVTQTAANSFKYTTKYLVTSQENWKTNYRLEECPVEINNEVYNAR